MGQSHANGKEKMRFGKEVAGGCARMPLLYGFAQKFWRHEPCRWCFTVVFAAFLGIASGKIVLGFSGSVSVVDGVSMEPTYAPGARVYTGPIALPLGRGDIVLLDDGNKEYALKRIVGLPGETIHIWRGYVFINRRLLREPYLPRFTFTFPDDHSNRFVFVLGPDEYFVMGDNRTCSVDSRRYGPVERKMIKKRVPQPESASRASLDHFTLPEEGKRTIRSL
jgi:signal peptidase I